MLEKLNNPINMKTIKIIITLHVCCCYKTHLGKRTNKHNIYIYKRGEHMQM